MEIVPEVYGSYVAYENWNAVIYLELLKSLYRMLILPLLFYQKFRKDIESIGFKVKCYDTCVAKNITRNKKITITWHVDDLKVSHSEKDVVGSFIEWTKETYEYVTKLNPSKGKIHDYVSMTLDSMTPGEVKVYMKEGID